MNRDEAFKPDDPFDALADLARKSVVNMGELLLDTNQYAALEEKPDDQAKALIIGLMTGLAAVAMAHAHPSRHRDVQAVLLQAIPFAVNQARDILDLPPLEPLQ